MLALRSSGARERSPARELSLISKKNFQFLLLSEGRCGFIKGFGAGGEPTRTVLDGTEFHWTREARPSPLPLSGELDAQSTIFNSRGESAPRGSTMRSPTLSAIRRVDQSYPLLYDFHWRFPSELQPSQSCRRTHDASAERISNARPGLRRLGRDYSSD
jgi:hypothetical protein